MDGRYWAGATLIVASILLFLAWDPKGPVDLAEDGPADAGITELGVDAQHVPIATVELDPGTVRDGGPGAGSALITRFEMETSNPAWSPVAEARVRTALDAVLQDHDASITAIDCRRTACRLVVTFQTAAARPDGVAALLAQLQDNGVPALLESADGDRAILLVAP